MLISLSNVIKLLIASAYIIPETAVQFTYLQIQWGHNMQETVQHAQPPDHVYHMPIHDGLPWQNPSGCHGIDSAVDQHMYYVHSAA